MFLQDEQNIIKWLSQYGALPKLQISKLLQVSEVAEEKILKNLQRHRKITEVGGGYYWGLDKLCKPEQRTELAVWVLIQFIDQVDPQAHYPAASCARSIPYRLRILRKTGRSDLIGRWIIKSKNTVNALSSMRMDKHSSTT